MLGCAYCSLVIHGKSYTEFLRSILYLVFYDSDKENCKYTCIVMENDNVDCIL